jgi:hypothetical protein
LLVFLTQSSTSADQWLKCSTITDFIICHFKPATRMLR